MTINRLLQDKDNYTNEISLLVSILIRYPQVSSLNYDPHLHSLRFSFLVSERISKESAENFRQNLDMSLEAFHFLDDTENPSLDISFRHMDTITCIEISKKTDSLSQDEISLMVMLLQDTFSNNLVMDITEPAVDEDLQLQEEIIDTMLLDLKGTIKDRNFFAYREEGRVLVFNK